MKSVLITGVSRGIGVATAKYMIDAGWRVLGVDIEDCAITDSLGGFWRGDVAEESFWTDTVVPELQGGGIDGIVNNAAIQPCTAIQDTSIQEWNRTMMVNLGAPFLATKYLAPLLARSGGSIVNVSSVHAIATSPGMAAYVASKGGLLAFTRACALELAEQGIRVNAVLPGAIDTPMLAKGLTRSGSPESRKLEVAQSTPLSRIADPEEVSATIAFLLDDEKSSFITGQTITVDGGVLASLSSE